MNRIYDESFWSGNLFVKKNLKYSGSFDLPLKNDEVRRSVFIGVQNKQENLDLQLNVTCDSSVIIAYLLTTNITSKTQ